MAAAGVSACPGGVAVGTVPAMDPLDAPVPAAVGWSRPAEFVLIDGDEDRLDRWSAEVDVIAAVLGSAAVRVEQLTAQLPAPWTRPGVEVSVTVANVDNETRYLPLLEATGYVLELRVPGYRVLTLPGVGVRVHVRDDDDPAVTAPRNASPATGGTPHRSR